jgi:hypothetical protein
LDVICAQLLATSEQGIAALTALKAQLKAQYDTPETPETDSIVQQASMATHEPRPTCSDFQSL